MTIFSSLAATLILTLTGTLADEPDVQDASLYVALKDVINRGAELYNGGEPAACYRLFEGSLITIKPTLTRYPELQKIIAKGLSGAEKDPVMWRRAFTLREVLDTVRAELNPRKIKEKPKSTDSDKQAEKLPAPKKEEEKKDPDKDGQG